MIGCFEEIGYFLAWEWINIALEYAAVAWVRLPRFFLAVVGVNLVTHPVLMFLLQRVFLVESFVDGPLTVLLCEVVVFLVEWACLVAVYGRAKARLLGKAALLMNCVSFATGLALLMRG